MTSKETIDLVTKQNQILQVNLEKHMDQVIGLQSTVISGRVDAKIDQKMGDIHKDIRKLLSHNDKQNGWIEGHTKRMDKLDGEDGHIESLKVEAIASKAHRSMMTKIFKNYKVIIGAVIITFFVLNSLFEYVNIRTIIEFAIKIFT